MRFLKRSNLVWLLAMMMVLTLTACGSAKEENKETKTSVENNETTEEKADDAKDETKKDEALSEATITEDEAIKLVKKEMGDDFSYIPADELKEQDGSKYYEIYVKQLLDEEFVVLPSMLYISTSLASFGIYLSTISIKYLRQFSYKIFESKIEITL